MCLCVCCVRASLRRRRAKSSSTKSRSWQGCQRSPRDYSNFTPTSLEPIMLRWSRTPTRYRLELHNFPIHCCFHLIQPEKMSTVASKTGESQRPGPQVCLHPGDVCGALLRWERATGEEDGFREASQHQPLCVWDAIHTVGEETRRRGGAVQETHHFDQWVSVEAALELGCEVLPDLLVIFHLLQRVLASPTWRSVSRWWSSRARRWIQSRWPSTRCRVRSLSSTSCAAWRRWTWSGCSWNCKAASASRWGLHTTHNPEIWKNVGCLVVPWPIFVSQVNAGPMAYARAFLEEKNAKKYPDNQVKLLKEIFR